ncbi:MAG: rod shape-determining protein MreD [Alistipes sp.]|nr:rod shape-determining protein MreD [Alistipes sp.]
MYRLLEYSLLFILLVLLQIFVFSRIEISVYIHPLIYVAFILLLPMEISAVGLLLLSGVMGVFMDFFMASAGLNTIAALFTAFCRPLWLLLLLGKDEVHDGGIPNVHRLGQGRFLKYISVLVLIHSATFFLFETLSFHYFYITLLRIVLSSLVTIGLVYFCQRFFAVSR